MLLFLPQILWAGGVGWLDQSAWFNPPKHGPQSRALYGTVRALSIVYNTFPLWSIANLLILFDLIMIMKCGYFAFYYMTIIYALMVLLITTLVTTITILYGLTV